MLLIRVLNGLLGLAVILGYILGYILLPATVGALTGTAITFAVDFLTGAIRVGFTIGTTIGSALMWGIMNFLWLGGPIEKEESSLDRRFHLQRAAECARDAARATALFAIPFAIALLMAAILDRASVPIAAAPPDWRKIVWGVALMASSLIVMWPAGLAGSALSYLRAAPRQNS